MSRSPTAGHGAHSEDGDSHSHHGSHWLGWLAGNAYEGHDDGDEEGSEYVGDHEDEGDQDDEEEDEDEEQEDNEEYGYPGNDVQLEVFIEEIPADGEGGERNTHRRVVRIGRGNESRPFLTQREFLALLRGQYLNPTLTDDEDGQGHRIAWNIGRPTREPDFPKVPSEEGRKLMESGAFGTLSWQRHDRKALARRILDREMGVQDPLTRKSSQRLMAQSMIPSTRPEMVINYDDPVCCGQFSHDGNFFYSCVKDFKVRMYDTSSPYNWKHYKTVVYPAGQWTMTDADLSPDNKWLAFTSLQPHVGIASTDPNDTGDPYSFDLSEGRRTGGNEYLFGGFPIFSIRFSGDGRHLVAGTGADSIVVFDIERRKVIHHVRGHADDVNAVSFADRLSPHILYSGSDDTTIKVWDTRSMGDRREAGAFVGHTEGLTYLDSKGDGRYILSNAKDQSMKLWDLRKAMTTARFEELDPTSATRNRDYEYDYRWQDYEDYQWFKHPHDNSLVTFRGHKVQRTLIRCHFSPAGSTDSHYVYSGSYDGYVYVWNLDATLVAKIDVRAATWGSARPRPNRRHRLHHGNPGGWEALVRDVGWHPNAPMLVASAWSGPAMEGGTASLHSFNEGKTDEGDPIMGIRLNETLEPYEDEEYPF